MADERTRRQKIEAMAAQDVSPNEAVAARAILDRLPEAPPPMLASPRVAAGDARTARRRPVTPDGVLRRAQVDAIRKAVDPKAKYTTLRFVSGDGMRIRVDL